jgi:PIN domain nuclease of toxin-antitoxin system
MSLLLDTCTFLWLAAGDPRLSAVAARAIADPANRCHLSVVSAWEVTVKYAAGKLPLAQPPDILIPAQRTLHRLDTLEMLEADALAVLGLPPHHHDPFDRMLICQALGRQFTILTPDRHILQYAVPTLW